MNEGESSKSKVGSIKYIMPQLPNFVIIYYVLFLYIIGNNEPTSTKKRTITMFWSALMPN